MRNKNCLGIVFCNTGDDNLSELTNIRTMGSVPFGCRYRMVDFALSSFVAAGITKVGLVTKRNFRSLSDHCGSGIPWDLARKHGGLVIHSPYSLASAGVYKGKIDALYGCRDYIEKSKEELVIVADSNVVTSFDLEKMISSHISGGADITVAYKKDIDGVDYFKLDGDRVVRSKLVGESYEKTENCSLGMTLLSRELLLKLLDEAMLHNYTDFFADILQRKADKYVINGYEVKEYAVIINSMQSFYDANMALLNKDIRDELFFGANPVFTKLRDDMPSRYGFDSMVSDSLIADGCIIEGCVKNSIIFRGVHIGKGATVENCILMQSGSVGENTSLNYVIADKNVTFMPSRTLMGCHSFPLVIGKGLTV